MSNSGNRFDGQDKKLTKRPARLTVAEWLTHSPTTLEVTSSRHSLSDIFRHSLLESIQSPAQRVVKLCGIKGIVMSADRISSFDQKVTFRIAIKMQSLVLIPGTNSPS